LEGATVGGAFFIPSYVAMAAAGGAIVGLPAAVVGVLLARRLSKKHKDYYADPIDQGGILLWVRVADKDREKLAVEILQGHSAKDVYVHDWNA